MRLKPEHAVLVNTRLQQMLAAFTAGNGDRPYFDLNHDDKEASAHPTEFFWGGDDPKTGGIRAKVNWTGAGERAVRGKDYSRFSPSFYPDKDGNVIDVPVNMGGLVNRAAFQKIQSVVRSKSAGAEEDSAEQQKQEQEKEPTIMKSLLAVLAKLGLITSAEVDEATAVTQVTAKFTEVTAESSKASGELVEANKLLETTKTELVKARKEAATTIVEAAIQAGRLPGQNDEVKAFWVASIEANPANAKALPEPNPALQKLVQAGSAKGAETKINAGAGSEHPFLVKAKELQTEKKISLEGAMAEVAQTDAKLYDEYRDSLGQAA